MPIADGRSKRPRGSLFTPGLSRDGGAHEVHIDSAQIRVLQGLYETHPTLVAAKSVLEARLLSSGLMMKHNGTPVELTPEFRHHIDDHWIRFSKDLISAYLVYGFAVVSYETEQPECATTRKRHKEKKNIDGADDSVTRSAMQTGGRLRAAHTVPIVVPPDAYRLSFELSGAGGYNRVYRIHRTRANEAMTLDTESVLFIRDPPDAGGNINSPMAAVHSISAFVDSLVDLAVHAECGRVRPTLVTQARKQNTQNGVAPQDMFFDAESRGISREQTDDDNAAAARSLQLQFKLCHILNQAGIQGPTRANIGSGGSSSAPPDSMGPVFTLPTEQELAPHVPVPQSRGDLESLLRLSVDFMCTAIGVPSSLLFEGRYSSNSTAHLALLNATVQQLSRSVDSVLTDAYLGVYGNNTNAAKEKSTPSMTAGGGSTAGQTIELVTSTSPLSASGEVLALFQGGLADYEAAAPLALHAVGLSQIDIEAALERHHKQSLQDKKRGNEDRAAELESRDLALRAQKVGPSAAATGTQGGTPNKDSNPTIDGKGPGTTE